MLFWIFMKHTFAADYWYNHVLGPLASFHQDFRSFLINTNWTSCSREFVFLSCIAPYRNKKWSFVWIELNILRFVFRLEDLYICRIVIVLSKITALQQLTQNWYFYWCGMAKWFTYSRYVPNKSNHLEEYDSFMECCCLTEEKNQHFR